MDDIVGLQARLDAKTKPNSDELTGGIEPEVMELLAEVPANLIVLPNDFVPFPWAARRLFTIMGKTRELYSRGGVVELKRDNTSGEQRLQIVSAAELRSRIDAKGRKVVAVHLSKQGFVLAPKRCSAETATALLVTKQALEDLPPIELVTNAPILIEHEGKLLTLGPGYHSESGGVYVLSGAAPEVVPLPEAVNAIVSLLDDYLFTAPADKSRAVAGFIGPAFRSGNLLPGHALINVIEANKSQTGKGYLLALQQAVHGETVHFISQTQGGVGSFDERLASALIKALPFVAIDNVRGRLDSTYLESIITSYATAQARVPYRGHVTVNVRRMTFQMTSNGIEATPDLGNRMLITRLLHQPLGYRFKKFVEGGLLEHVIGRRGYYLGCVQAILRHWYESGKPRLDTDHSFREWVGTCDWIVQKIFKLPPLLEGHGSAVARTSNPALSWLRAIALVVLEQGRGGQYLIASELHELTEMVGLHVPNTRAETPDEQVIRMIGKHLGTCFGQENQLQLDSVCVRRCLVRVENAQYDSKMYVFWNANDGEPPSPPDGSRKEAIPM
jgi:hypothetical protein